MTAVGAMAGPKLAGGNVVAVGRQGRWCTDSVDIDLFGQALEALWSKAFEGEPRSYGNIADRAAGQTSPAPANASMRAPV